MQVAILIRTALTIDHSPGLAQKEADELAKMITKMGERLNA